jgi:hypothetical protein
LLAEIAGWRRATPRPAAWRGARRAAGAERSDVAVRACAHLHGTRTVRTLYGRQPALAHAGWRCRAFSGPQTNNPYRDRLTVGSCGDR